jgi:uncharacterized repeat protein (TIGR03803 family)
MRKAVFALCILAATATACSRLSSTPALPAANVAKATTTSNFQILHVFKSASDGTVPVGLLLPIDGTLYGTTNFGGETSKRCYPGTGCGVIYQITGSSILSVIYRFHGNTDGTRPYSGLISVSGTLYGTTQSGGKNNRGTVYRVSSAGSEDVVWAFNGKDGQDPRANLTSYQGTIFGTTYYGGSAGTGTVFTITTSGNEEVLHNFKGGKDGAQPLGTLLLVGNNLYGTASSGGTHDDGTVFRISPNGNNYKTLYSFKGGGDGAYPFAGLTELNGALYGTTAYGGASNKGTVFAITTKGSETVLHSFGSGEDGFEPYAGLTVLNGQLYGTTAYGGTSGSTSGAQRASKKPTSEGTIYTITPSGTEQVVHNFTGGPGGRVPYANLTVMNGSLYGTTIWGGNAKGPKGGVGTLFEFTPGTNT